MLSKSFHLTRNSLNSRRRLLYLVLFQSLCIVSVFGSGDLEDLPETRDAQARSVVLTFSPIHLMYFAEKEVELYVKLQELKNSTKSEEQLRHVETWLADYRESTPMVTTNFETLLSTSRISAELVVSHPLMVLRMLRRFAKILPSIIDLNSNKDVPTGLIRKVDELKIHGDYLPTVTDLQHSQKSIIRLSDVYRLNPYSVIGGKIGNLKTKVGLTLEQALEIALEAVEDGNLEFAYDWLDAVSNMKSEMRNNWEDAVVLDRLIEGLIFKIENTPAPNDLETAAITSASNSNTNIEEPEDFPINESVWNQNMNQSHPSPSISSDTEGFTYDIDTLCNGITLMPEAERSKLHCWYEGNQDLAWLIGPLRMELLDARIHLVVIYDAIGDRMINQIINSCKGCMERLGSKEQITKNGSANISDDYLGESTCRLKYQVWQNELDLKIKKMLGVSVVKADEFGGTEFAQVTSASVGGHVIPHIDAFTGKVETSDGIRFASLLIYMNNVELGGHLVFPELGLGIVPRKGLAVFWHNYITETRDTDPLTVHTGCPILFGQKWFIKYAKPFRL